MAQADLQRIRLGLLGLAILLPWLFPPQGGPSPGVQPWLFSVACMAVLLIGASLADLTTASGRAVVAGAWLAAGLLSSVTGLCQYFEVEHHFAPWMSEAGPGEAYGNLRQRNQFASLTNIATAALLYLTTRLRAMTVWQRLGVLVAAAVLATGTAAAASRTGLLGLLLILGLGWVWGSWRQDLARRVIIVALGSYVLAGWMLAPLAGYETGSSGIYARFVNTGPECAGRLSLWSNMLYLISQRPWSGWGWGELDFAHFITDYPGTRNCELLDNAHNLPLHLAVELGIPAAALISAAGAWLIVRARPWREENSGRRMAWAVLALILLHSMLEYPLWYGPFQLTMVLALGMLLARPAKPQPVTLYRQASWQGGLAVLMLAAAAYAAWDYHRVSQIFYPPDFRAAAYRDNTLEKIRGTWLFQDQAQFAEFTLTPLTPGNAEHLYEMGQRVLHYSPEARVVEKLIECAVLLGRDEAARFYLARYKAAFPKEHARWAARQLEPVKPH